MHITPPDHNIAPHESPAFGLPFSSVNSHIHTLFLERRDHAERTARCPTTCCQSRHTPLSYEDRAWHGMAARPARLPRFHDQLGTHQGHVQEWAAAGGHASAR